MASTPTHHYYRLEISGDHTGSAYRYSSEIAGTLGEIKKTIVEEMSDAQGLSFLISLDCTFQLEMYEDGSQLGVWNLYPAVQLKVKKTTLTFLENGDIEGFEQEDKSMLFEDPVIGPILEGEVEPKPVVDFAVLDLPTPRGKPLPKGSKASFERDGRTETQPYGFVIDWNDSSHRPQEKAAKRAKAGAKKVKAAPGSAKANAKPAKVTATPARKNTRTAKPTRGTTRPEKATARPAKKNTKTAQATAKPTRVATKPAKTTKTPAKTTKTPAKTTAKTGKTAPKTTAKSAKPAAKPAKTTSKTARKTRTTKPAKVARKPTTRR